VFSEIHSTALLLAEMLDDIRQFQGLICSSPYNIGQKCFLFVEPRQHGFKCKLLNFFLFYITGLASSRWSSLLFQIEWPVYTGSITTVYDDFGDGKGFCATSFDTKPAATNFSVSPQEHIPPQPHSSQFSGCSHCVSRQSKMISHTYGHKPMSVRNTGGDQLAEIDVRQCSSS
jgi:hypothetical protein